MHLYHNDLFELDAEQVPPYTASAAIYDHMMREVDYPGWAKYLVLLMKVAGKETRRSKIRGEKLCELACGTAKISIILSRLGYNVTGVDSSGEMLAVATQKLARRRRNEVHLVHHDMVTYSSPLSYSRAICVYDSLNYIPTEEGVGEFFSNVYASMNPGGVFVFDASMESNSLNDADLFVQQGKYKGIYYHRKSQYDPVSRTHATYVRVKKDGRVFEEVHREHVYEIKLIRKLFLEAGFEEKLAAGDFTLLEANDNSERVHFVLVKPEND